MLFLLCDSVARRCFLVGRFRRFLLGCVHVCDFVVTVDTAVLLDLALALFLFHVASLSRGAPVHSTCLPRGICASHVLESWLFVVDLCFAKDHFQ